MADYTATMDMTLEQAIANGSMGYRDDLTIKDGATVTCTQTPSACIGRVYVRHGEFVIDGASATNPIIFVRPDNSYGDNAPKRESFLNPWVV
jgi:hypothetical protein